MSDKREAILERLLAIAAAVDGIKTAARNRSEFDDTQLPAVSILEGDETVSSASDERRHQRSSGAPRVMAMQPQLLIEGGNSAANLGASLNKIRAALISAVEFDTQLAALAARNGAVAYRGLNSDLGIGRHMLGRMALIFAIHYVLDPSQL